MLSLATATYHHPLFITVLNSKHLTAASCHAEGKHAAAAAPHALNGKSPYSTTRGHDFTLTPHSRAGGAAPSRPPGSHLGASQAARMSIDDEDDEDDEDWE